MAADDRADAARARILIVEDDPSIAAGLAMNLRFEGHTVAIAADGEAGLREARAGRPDLVILDLMLPKMNGFEVCRALREAKLDVGVIMLTAKGTEGDKVLGLGVGADDYVTKPFGIRELCARVQAVLRRRGEGVRPVAFGAVAVDLSTRAVTRDGAPVELTAQELRLLEQLVRHPGRVFSRQQLLDAAWGRDYVGGERTVDNFVRRLRVKLEENADAPRHIVTVVGLGYRFEP